MQDVGSNTIQVAVNNLTPTFWSICLLIVITIGTLIKAWPLLDKQKRDSDASLRGDLLDRIADLEKQVLAERRHCDEELAQMRAQLDAMQRIIVQLQVSTGRVIDLSGAPSSASALDKIEAHLRDKGVGE